MTGVPAFPFATEMPPGVRVHRTAPRNCCAESAFTAAPNSMDACYRPRHPFQRCSQPICQRTELFSGFHGHG
jgi:hypothetical protein